MYHIYLRHSAQVLVGVYCDNAHALAFGTCINWHGGI